MCDIDWDLILKFATLITGMIALYKGLKEYSNSQKWKKAEFLADEYTKFINSPYVQAAVHMLDGYEMPIIVKIENGDSFTIDYKRGKLAAALNKDGKHYTQGLENVHIRLCLDKFLFKLGLFQSHLSNELISQYSLNYYLSYWIEFIGKLMLSVDDPQGPLLNAYIKDNNYNNLLQLLKTYGYK